MGKKSVLKNSVYIIFILILPYLWAWVYAEGITYYKDIITWNSDISYVFKQMFYYMIIICTIAVLLLHSELSYRISKRLDHGKKIIVSINILYIILYPISIYGAHNSNILSFTAMLYSYSPYVYMFALSCAYSIYNIHNWKRSL